MDVERIREALAMLHRFPHMRHGIELQPLAEVARLVVEAREVWWCEEHKSTGWPSTNITEPFCWRRAWLVESQELEDFDPDCRMVRRLLVPPKGET